jgi:hypothetical protein
LHGLTPSPSLHSSDSFHSTCSIHFLHWQIRAQPDGDHDCRRRRRPRAHDGRQDRLHVRARTKHGGAQDVTFHFLSLSFVLFPLGFDYLRVTVPSVPPSCLKRFSSQARTASCPSAPRHAKHPKDMMKYEWSESTHRKFFLLYNFFFFFFFMSRRPCSR